jgi:hypothetical protein
VIKGPARVAIDVSKVENCPTFFPSNRAENIDYPMTHLRENYCRGGSTAFITSCFLHGSTRAIYPRAHRISQQNAGEKIRSKLSSPLLFSPLLSSPLLSSPLLSSPPRSFLICFSDAALSVYLTSGTTLCLVLNPFRALCTRPRNAPQRFLTFNKR